MTFSMSKQNLSFNVQIVFVALLLVGLVFLSSCRPTPRSREPVPSAAESKSYPANVFSAPRLSDPAQLMGLEDLKGKVVLIDFWATWCAPCRYEIPALNALYDEYKGRGFDLVGMTVDRGKISDVHGLVSRIGPRYPTVLADESVQAAFGGIRVVPTKFLLDKEGNVRKRYEGVVPEEVLRNDIESLLAL